MSFGYDPEVPAGFQDADFEMAELEAAGNRAAALAREGVCVHGSTFCPPDGDGTVYCNDCPATFPNREAHMAAHDRALYG